MNQLIHFIKYNNTFTIILVFLILGGAGAFASDEVRDNVIGETVTTVAGIDNTAILALDADNFNLNLTIAGVTEDEKNYYVFYSYNTMAIQNNVWQPIIKEKSLNVFKERLNGGDLGLYVAQQLGETADYELNYLWEVKSIESGKGVQQQVASIAYTGLKGLIFDPENKVLEGYAAVVTENNDEIIGEFNADNSLSEIDSGESLDNGIMAASETAEPSIVQIVQQSVDRETIREIVREMLAESLVATENTAGAAETANTTEIVNTDETTTEIIVESAAEPTITAEPENIESAIEAPIIEQTPVATESVQDSAPSVEEEVVVVVGGAESTNSLDESIAPPAE